MRLSDAQHPGWPISTVRVRTVPRPPAPSHRDSLVRGDSRPHGNFRVGEDAIASAPKPAIVRLRPLEKSDGALWRQMRISDERFLRPVEPTVQGAWSEAHTAGAWRQNYKSLRGLAKTGILVPAAIEADGEFVGQLTLGNIQHGAVSSCWIGYWVHSSHRGRGIATAAVALGVDHAMQQVGVHRVEATVMENNWASRRVLEKAGFRREGFLERNLHINGVWQDHLLVGMTSEDVHAGGFPGVVSRLLRARLLSSH